MPASVRPYVTAGVALVGASVISITPITPAATHVRAATDAYSLTAAANPFGPMPGGAIDPSGDGIACSGYHTDQCDIDATQTYTPITVDTNGWAFKNLLPNAFNALISIPRAYLDALNDVAYSLEVTGSWWVYTPTNVLGYDPADPAKITSITNLLIPFKPLSNALGEHLSWWAKANLPMNAGCTGTAPPTCRHADEILANMFTAPIWQLIAGYTFPQLNNPVSEAEGEAGEEIPGQTGAPVPWSGQHIQINPYDPIYNVINYFFADPAQNRPEKITFADVAETFGRLAKGLVQDFYPFVPGSFLWKGFPYTLVTPFIKPFVKILCPRCDPEHPEDPTPFDGELPPSSTDGTTGGAGAGKTTVLASLAEKIAAKQEAKQAAAESRTGATLVAEKTVESGEESTEATPAGDTAAATPVAPATGDVVATAVTNLVRKFQKTPRQASTDGTDSADAADGASTGSATAGSTDSGTASTGSDDAKPAKKSLFGGGRHAKADDASSSSTGSKQTAKHRSGSKATAGSGSAGGSDSGGDTGE